MTSYVVTQKSQTCRHVGLAVYVDDTTELDMDWIHPWIGLDWVRSFVRSLFSRRRKRLRL